MREKPRDKERLNYQIKDEIIWATIETELLPLKEKIILLLAD